MGHSEIDLLYNDFALLLQAKKVIFSCHTLLMSVWVREKGKNFGLLSVDFTDGC